MHACLQTDLVEFYGCTVHILHVPSSWRSLSKPGRHWISKSQRASHVSHCHTSEEHPPTTLLKLSNHPAQTLQPPCLFPRCTLAHNRPQPIISQKHPIFFFVAPWWKWTVDPSRGTLYFREELPSYGRHIFRSWFWQRSSLSWGISKMILWHSVQTKWVAFIILTIFFTDNKNTSLSPGEVHLTTCFQKSSVMYMYLKLFQTIMKPVAL